jgi:hypothetical protein
LLQAHDLSGVSHVVHSCPVCNARHEITAVRAAMAYGRQLCCSPDCEGERRRQARSGWRRIVAA